MKGNRPTNNTIVIAFAVIFCFVLTFGYFIRSNEDPSTSTNSPTFAEENATISVTEEENPTQENPVSIDDAVAKPLIEADQQQIIETQNQIVAVWNDYNEQYLKLTLQDNLITVDAEDYSQIADLYQEAETKVNSTFMYPEMYDTFTKSLEQLSSYRMSSLLETPDSGNFKEVSHFEGEVRFLTVEEFKQLHEGNTTREEFMPENSSRFTLDPKQDHSVEYLDDIISRVHVMGFSQYVLSVQEVRVSTIVYNNDTQQNEELNQKFQSADRPYFNVLTLYAKYQDTWYPFPITGQTENYNL